ncbi:hypothetical protein ACOSQ2_017088 [Xanthoceras sorbifolium]
MKFLEEWNVRVLSFSKGLIDARICRKNGFMWHFSVTGSNPDLGEAKQNHEGVVAEQPRTTQSGQYLVSDRRTSRGKPGIDQRRRIPEVDVTIKRRLFIVTSTSGIRLNWSVYARFAPRSPTVTHKVLSALGRPGLPRHNALTVLLRLPQIRI